MLAYHFHSTFLLAALIAGCSATSSGTAAGVGGQSNANGGANNNAGNGNTTAGTGNNTAGNANNTAGNTSNNAAGASSVTVTSASCSATVSGVSLDLPPPKQCGNQDYVQGCIWNDTSICSGRCGGYSNACQQVSATFGGYGSYGGVDGFACPSWMLYSDQMRQAAINDGNSMFNYAVVGHDVDTGGIDGTLQSSCCECYQLVFDYPKENQAWFDPNTTGTPVSAVPPPPPLIVQSFNTGTNGVDDFDIFMAAGGFGGNNACDPNASMKAVSGVYSYTNFPVNGANEGGVKAANKYTECKTATQWVTGATIGSDACQAKVSADCNQITAGSAQITNESRCSCLQTNQPTTFYHMNWNVYAMRVECPANLTKVTGCRLKSQSLPNVNQSVTTASQAASNASFKAKAGNGNRFYTTTMQDCCKPSCASQNWVGGRGLVPDGLYNSFYTCNQAGVPQTE